MTDMPPTNDTSRVDAADAPLRPASPVRRTAARVLGRRDPGPFDPLRLLPLTYVVVLAFLGMSVLLIAADLLDPVKAL